MTIPETEFSEDITQYSSEKDNSNTGRKMQFHKCNSFCQHNSQIIFDDSQVENTNSSTSVNITDKPNLKLITEQISRDTQRFPTPTKSKRKQASNDNINIYFGNIIAEELKKIPETKRRKILIKILEVLEEYHDKE